MRNPFSGVTVPMSALNELDEAELLSEAAKKYAVKELATVLDVSEAHIYHRMRLLTLDPAVQDSLRAGKVKSAFAFEMAAMPPAKQKDAMAIIFTKKPSLREFKRRIRTL